MLARRSIQFFLWLVAIAAVGRLQLACLPAAEPFAPSVSQYLDDDRSLPTIPGGLSAKDSWSGCTQDDLCRAGCPNCVRCRAIPSNNNRYCGYYVGGGTPLFGPGRCLLHDGTWGWDYCGIPLLKYVQLSWHRCDRYQGGTGAYKTDGPKLRHE